MSEQYTETTAQSRGLNVAEYVLGTLDTATREQIDNALASDANLQRELDYWEQRLGALCLAVAPVEPPVHVWPSIREQAGLDHPRVARISQAAASSPAAANKPASSTTVRRSSRFWPGLAVAASLVAVVLASALFNTGSTDADAIAASPAYASVVYDKPTGMSWLVTGDAQPTKFSVRAMGQFPLPQGKTLRAWLKPASGPAVFLGPWPYTPGEHSLPLPAAAVDKLANASNLMVTMEDATQSAGPVPNGRVMWISPVAHKTS